MKNGYPIRRLSDVCDFRGGGTPSKSNQGYWEGDIPWVSPKDVKSKIVSDSIDHISSAAVKNSSASIIPKNSILLVVRSGILARTIPIAITGRDLTVNQDIKALCPKTSLDSEYLYYFLEAESGNILSLVTRGATVHRLSTDHIKSLLISVPPIEEQRRIVAILDQAFEAIDKAKQNTEKNLQNARELFDSYLQNIFTNPGAGWTRERVVDICTLKSGTTISPTLELSEGEIPYLKVADMNLIENRSDITTSSRFLTRNSANENHIFPVGTTIFPKRGGAIATNKKRITSVPICADLNIMGAIPSERIDPNYLYNYFRTFNLVDIANGTTVLQINNYSLEPLLIAVPPSKEEQERISNRLEEIKFQADSLESTYRQKIQMLDVLKKSILQKAFNGELIRTNG